MGQVVFMIKILQEEFGIKEKSPLRGLNRLEFFIFFILEFFLKFGLVAED